MQATQVPPVLVWCWCRPPGSDIFVPSHVALVAGEAGVVACQAEQTKTLKYAHLNSIHHFVPVAFETSGVFGPEAMTFVKELGHQVRAETGEPRFLQFLLQGMVVVIQRGNAAAVLGTSYQMDNVFISFPI